MLLLLLTIDHFPQGVILVSVSVIIRESRKKDNLYRHYKLLAYKSITVIIW